MYQVWIVRQDQKPADALQSGDDVSVCGDCPLRRSVCYVSIIHAPRAVYEAYKLGSYHHMRPVDVPTDKPIRLGAYGDPGAVPTAVWRALPTMAGRTGYTHQWRKRPALKRLVMASCETEEQTRQAQEAGWRTFRVKTADAPVMTGEIVCPASSEAGMRTTCERCRLCDGSAGPNDRRKSVVINAH